MPSFASGDNVVQQIVNLPSTMDKLRRDQLTRQLRAAELERQALAAEQQRLRVKYGEDSSQAQDAATRLGLLDQLLKLLTADLDAQQG
jgi:hypothetical protein